MTFHELALGWGQDLSHGVCDFQAAPTRGVTGSEGVFRRGVFPEDCGAGLRDALLCGVPLPEEQSWVLGLHPHGGLTPLLLSPFPLPHLHNGLFVPGPQTPSAQPPDSAAGVGMAHLS